MPPPELLFTGDVFCDLVFRDVAVPEEGAEVFSAGFGLTAGGVANRAVAAARLGARSAIVSALGDDPLGRHVRGLLEDEEGLDVSLLAILEGRQSPVSAALTGAHDRSFITYREALAPPAVDPEALAGVRAVHVALDAPLPEWVAPLRAGGTLVVGGVGWDASGEWSPTVLARLAEVDVFVPNDVEAMRYTGCPTALQAARTIASHGPLAVVTCGSRGAVAVAADGAVTEEPRVEAAALDPTGAGDVFVAALMVALEQPWTTAEMLRLANLTAALSVERLGGAAGAPTPADLAARIAREDDAERWGFLATWLGERA